MPCPYERHRPVRRNGSGDCEPSQPHSSRTSVVLPMPASPRIVTSCGSSVARARAYDARSSVHLLLAAHERLPQSSDAPRSHERQRADESPADDAAFLALRLDTRRLLQLEGAAHCRRRAFADEDLARPGCLLQPCRDVDGVAAHEGASLTRRSDDNLAGVHPDAQREGVAEELVEPQPHRERGVQGSFRVVFQRERCTERRHDGVADELLDGSPGTADLGSHRVVEAIQQRPGALRVLSAR